MVRILGTVALVALAASAGCSSKSTPGTATDAGSDVGAAGTAGSGGTAGTGGDSGTDASTAALMLVPGSADFGSLAVGQTSPPKSLQLQNSGASATGTLQIAISGANAAEFQETDDCGTTLAAGTSCTIQVTASPTALGALSATLGASATPGDSANASLTARGDDLTDLSKWTLYSVAGGGGSYDGATFDGRYLYFAPSLASGTDENSLALRYDTQAGFAAAGSWTTFDLSAVDAGAKGFAGAAFDGRYVYFVPAYNGAHDGIVARYDTQATFGAAGSWATFDAATADPNAKYFRGAVFDGRYVYFCPYNDGVFYGAITRYDTQASFTSATAWSTFDATTVDTAADGFAGAIFDGRYVYFVPGNKLVTRYDTQGSFTTKTSWATFNTTTLDANARGFRGGAFDGRYVYFTPDYNGTSAVVVTRYDTQAAFGSSSSWATFDATALDPTLKGLASAGFDGRYVYFGSPYAGAPAGSVVRYDTHAGFTDAGSWGNFNIATQNSGVAFAGSVFDGRYVYFVPGSSLVATRFDARQPAAMPTLCSNAAALHCFSGSFY